MMCSTDYHVSCVKLSCTQVLDNYIVASWDRDLCSVPITRLRRTERLLTLDGFGESILNRKTPIRIWKGHWRPFLKVIESQRCKLHWRALLIAMVEFAKLKVRGDELSFFRYFGLMLTNYMIQVCHSIYRHYSVVSKRLCYISMHGIYIRRPSTIHEENWELSWA